jgi:hypothetical protein
MNTKELHDYLERHHNSRAKKYLLSVDTESRSSGVWLTDKVTAYRLTAEAFATGVAEHIRLSEFKGEDAWDIFASSYGEEQTEMEPELRKHFDAAKAKRRTVKANA